MDQTHRHKYPHTFFRQCHEGDGLSVGDLCGLVLASEEYQVDCVVGSWLQVTQFHLVAVTVEQRANIRDLQQRKKNSIKQRKKIALNYLRERKKNIYPKQNPHQFPKLKKQ